MKYPLLCLAALLSFAAAGSASAFTLDIGRMKAHATPASDTLEAAQICSAMSMAFAFTYGDDKSDEGKTQADKYTLLSRMWLGIAADKSGVSYNDYIDNTAMTDMQSLADLDADTLDFYDGYCQQSAREVIAAAHTQ